MNNGKLAGLVIALSIGLVPASAAPATADGQCEFVTRHKKVKVAEGSGVYINMKNWWNQCGNHAHARKFRIWWEGETWRVRSVSYTCTARDNTGSVRKFTGALSDGSWSQSAWFPTPRRAMYYSNNPRGVCSYDVDVIMAPDHQGAIVKEINHP